jgi:hypothetical protein
MKTGRESRLKTVPSLCQDGILAAIGWGRNGDRILSDADPETLGIAE